MRWERRLETADGLVVLDCNTELTPITLTITPHMHMTGHCTFTDLISTWMQELSMKTALLQAPPCLCLAIDRFFQAADGAIERSLCKLEMVTEVNMPVFISTDLRFDFSGYIPVAGVAHLGTDLAGHCRALLKLMPSMVTATENPEGMLEPMTASSVAEEMRSDSSYAAPMNELLTLLQAQTGATDLT